MGRMASSSQTRRHSCIAGPWFTRSALGSEWGTCPRAKSSLRTHSIPMPTDVDDLLAWSSCRTIEVSVRRRVPPHGIVLQLSIACRKREQNDTNRRERSSHPGSWCHGSCYTSLRLVAKLCHKGYLLAPVRGGAVSASSILPGEHRSTRQALSLSNPCRGRPSRLRERRALVRWGIFETADGPKASRRARPLPDRARACARRSARSRGRCGAGDRHLLRRGSARTASRPA
jgi:hypothetical protein